MNPEYRQYCTSYITSQYLKFNSFTASDGVGSVNYAPRSPHRAQNQNPRAMGTPLRGLSFLVLNHNANQQQTVWIVLSKDVPIF